MVNCQRSANIAAKQCPVSTGDLRHNRYGSDATVLYQVIPGAEKSIPVFNLNYKETPMENEDENRDHNPLKDNQDDSWIIAALTTAFAAGVGATIAAIKLVSKIVSK